MQTKWNIWVLCYESINLVCLYEKKKRIKPFPEYRSNQHNLIFEIISNLARHSIWQQRLWRQRQRQRRRWWHDVHFSIHTFSMPKIKQYIYIYNYHIHKIHQQWCDVFFRHRPVSVGDLNAIIEILFVVHMN